MEPHSHIFLGEGYEHAERRTWAVIWLCAAMMALEIVGGMLFGSIALVADGLHMSTHAGALLLAALAYGYARRHATDAISRGADPTSLRFANHPASHYNP